MHLKKEVDIVRLPSIPKSNVGYGGILKLLHKETKWVIFKRPTFKGFFFVSQYSKIIYENKNEIILLNIVMQ